MVTRDFDAMLAESRGERPTFRVGGQVYTLRRKIGVKAWFKMFEAMRATEDNDVANERFFSTVLISRDVPRFLEAYRRGDEPAPDGVDPDDWEDNVMDVAVLDLISEWAMEYLSGKPSADSSSFSPGANRTGVAPKPASLTPAAA